MTAAPWAVLDKDGALLRVEPTKVDALHWAMIYTGAEGVVDRIFHTPGRCTYTLGPSDEPTVVDLVRLTRRTVVGVDCDLPRYPHADHPFLEEVHA